ncbi:uncharacterized protein C19orf44 homolog isoform X2 [Cottoperca gobio]|uniref:Uncharacterized protein C19orf44 homolog isoform X2 n=1 Tax=Cottoperca gobio TaxID=56716 RepID=A0A6J2PI07_COTGO|nr:uncharacterized protein C19orf44 homolog isoform X2 [Cottoperca gobio]
MWKRGGQSFALDRAQALLSAKRGSAVPLHTGDMGGSVKNRSSSPNTHPLFSDVSDLSTGSLAPEHGADTMLRSAAAAGKTQESEGHSTKDLRPQSSLGGRGSRFLKKAPPPATNSSQSMQQVPEHRSVSSSQRGSQTAALSRLAQIESRIHSRKQVQEQARQQGPTPAEILTSDMGASPPPAARSLEAPVQLPAQSRSDQSLKGKHVLKNKTAGAANPSTDVGVRSRSRAADAVGPRAGLETKPVRVVSAVSLGSDEEDMRKLLGDSLDSIDRSFLIPGRPSHIRTADKMLSESSQRVHSSPPPAAVPPSSSSITAPRSPASPSRRGSPFRFTGQAQAHFSPSARSPSPSPLRVGSPQRSLSSMSGRGEVISLEELFSVGPGSEDGHSERSAVISEDFKINVMTLDDLVPASLGFTEETPGKEREVKHSGHLPRSTNKHQQRPRLTEKKEEEQQQKDTVHYQSDFESESRTEPDYSVSQVSEHLQGDGGEEEVSEVREEALDSDMSRGRTEDDYSSTFSDTSRSCTSRTSDISQTNRSRSSGSHSSRTSPRQLRRASTRKTYKEEAVQTQPDPMAYTWPAGTASLGPAVGMAYMDPSPVVAHTLSAEMVEALSTFNPAVFALNEMLKQQLAMTRRFIESSRHLHSSLVQSLGPPNYRYTTLEDTREYIRKHRAPRLTMEEAFEEALQDRTDYCC